MREKHKVRLTRPYYMSKFEITIKEWNEVFGDVLNKETTFFLPENQIDICKWFVNQTNSGPFKKNFSSAVATNEILKVLPPK